MTIKEFAQERGVRPNTVSAYISSHQDEFSGHISYDGKKAVLDDTALEILDKKYPVLPLDVIPDEEKIRQMETVIDAAKNEIMRLQRKLETMQDEMRTMAEKAALAEARQLLIESKDDQIKAEQERAATAEARADKAAEDLRSADLKVAEAEKEAKEAADQAAEERRRADQAEEARKEAEKRAEEKAAEIEQLRNRGLWARILNK